MVYHYLSFLKVHYTFVSVIAYGTYVHHLFVLLMLLGVFWLTLELVW